MPRFFSPLPEQIRSQATGPWQFATALAVEGLLLLRAGTRSRRGVKEARDRAAELRRRRNRSRRINHDDKVRLCRNDKGVGNTPKSGSQTDHSTVAQIVQTQVCRIVAAQICGAFDIASPSERSVDRDSEARRRTAIICKVERLEAFRSRETTTRARFSSAPAWQTITSESIRLGRIIRVKHVCRDRLIGSARAGWYAK